MLTLILLCVPYQRCQHKQETHVSFPRYRHAAHINTHTQDGHNWGSNVRHYYIHNHNSFTLTDKSYLKTHKTWTRNEEKSYGLHMGKMDKKPSRRTASGKELSRALTTSVSHLGIGNEVPHVDPSPTKARAPFCMHLHVVRYARR